METTFYDDSQFLAAAKSTKRPISLDLQSPGTLAKKQRLTTLLTSPDLHMLKLASPELERFIIANGGIATPTPTQYLFPKNVTEDQEQYARGFVDALNQLHQTSVEGSQAFFARGGDLSSLGIPTSNANKLFSTLMPIYLTSPTSVIKSNTTKPAQSATVKPSLVIRPPSVDNCSSNSSQSIGMPLTVDMPVKEELQMVPSDLSTPPLSPISYKAIDMVDQERIKLERKRHRNRIAATKCRRRKLEKISKLEEKVNELKGENSDLLDIADKLRDQVCRLKQQVLEHAKSGCQIMITHHL